MAREQKAYVVGLLLGLFFGIVGTSVAHADPLDSVYIAGNFGRASLPVDDLKSSINGQSISFGGVKAPITLQSFSAASMSEMYSVGIGIEANKWLRLEYMHHNYGNYSATATAGYSYTTPSRQYTVAGKTLSAPSVTISGTINGNALASIGADVVRFLPQYKFDNGVTPYLVGAVGHYQADYTYTAFVPVGGVQVSKTVSGSASGAFAYGGAGVLVPWRKDRFIGLEFTWPYPRTTTAVFNLVF